MELFKLYSKEKTKYFCLIKLLFIKARCLINNNISLEAILEEGQGWSIMVAAPLILGEGA